MAGELVVNAPSDPDEDPETKVVMVDPEFSDGVVVRYVVDWTAVMVV